MSIAIIPTILATTTQELLRQYEALMPLSPRIQVDVADGDLVDGRTIPLTTIIAHLTTRAHEFPHTQFDVHLMVRDWVPMLALLKEASAHIRIHLVLPHYAVYKPSDSEGERATTTLTVGVVFSPDDPLDTSVLQHLSAVQIMTVVPGKQGGSFIPTQLKHIETLREHGYAQEIMLDGGINTETLPLILAQRHLPSAIGVGSYLTRSPHPADAYRTLVQLATTP